MKPIKSHFSFFCLAILIAWLLPACTSSEERITAQFDTLPQIDSTILYEYSAAYSSATGDCGGTFQDRWYGTSMSAEDVEKLFSDYLSLNGWSIWPEEVIEIWSREDDDGLYRMSVDIFAEAAEISQEQASYKLPKSVLVEASQYQTIYLLSMTYKTLYAAKKCFGR